MKLFKCDLCDKECDSLVNLFSDYQTEYIKHLCEGCHQTLENVLTIVRTNQHELQKKALNKFLTEKKKWYQGFLKMKKKEPPNIKDIIICPLCGSTALEKLPPLKIRGILHSSDMICRSCGESGDFALIPVTGGLDVPGVPFTSAPRQRGSRVALPEHESSGRGHLRVRRTVGIRATSGPTGSRAAVLLWGPLLCAQSCLPTTRGRPAECYCLAA